MFFRLSFFRFLHTLAVSPQAWLPRWCGAEGGRAALHASPVARGTRQHLRAARRRALDGTRTLVHGPYRAPSTSEGGWGGCQKGPGQNCWLGPIYLGLEPPVGWDSLIRMRYIDIVPSQNMDVMRTDQMSPGFVLPFCSVPRPSPASRRRLMPLKAVHPHQRDGQGSQDRHGRSAARIAGADLLVANLARLGAGAPTIPSFTVSKRSLEVGCPFTSPDCCTGGGHCMVLQGLTREHPGMESLHALGSHMMR